MAENFIKVIKPLWAVNLNVKWSIWVLQKYDIFSFYSVIVLNIYVFSFDQLYKANCSL